MKKNKFSINLVLIIIILLLMTGGVATGANPGTTSDPIVTQSYVEGRLNALNASIDERLTALEERPAGTSDGGTQAFAVEQVFTGQIIHLEANSLFILRAGLATAIAGPGGGLSNLTDGFDLATGESLTKNHLILTPKSDGRGVQMTSDGWVMISGGYTIE